MLLWPNWPELFHTPSLLVRIYLVTKNEATEHRSFIDIVHRNHRVINNSLGKCTLNYLAEHSAQLHETMHLSPI